MLKRSAIAERGAEGMEEDIAEREGVAAAAFVVGEGGEEDDDGEEAMRVDEEAEMLSTRMREGSEDFGTKKTRGD